MLDGLEELRKRSAGHPAVRVAMIDGPIDSQHPCFTSTTFASPLLLDVPDHEATAHGTAFGSILFGDDPPRFRGLAPRCSVLVIPALQSAHRTDLPGANEADIVEGIHSAMRHRCQIICTSIGIPVHLMSRALVDAVAKARNAGVVIVASAANVGCDVPVAPACLDAVLECVAVDARGELLSCASSGANSLSAVGRDVPVAIPGGAYGVASGASFATAQIAGAIALLCSLAQESDRNWAAAEVADVLTACATEGSSDDDRRPNLVTAIDILQGRKAHPRERGPRRTTSQDDQSLASHEAPPPGPTSRPAVTLAACKTFYRSVEPRRFGTTRVEVSDRISLNCADVHYDRGSGDIGLQLTPVFEDETRDHSDRVEALLREATSLEAEDPVYAHLVYLDATEPEVALDRLLASSKRRLGFRHHGAYIGNGRVTQSLVPAFVEEWPRLDGYYRWRLAGNPANVYTLQMKGVSSAVLNRNLCIVDAILSTDAHAPADYEALGETSFALNDCLRAYASALSGEDAPPVSCSDLKTVIATVAMNLPHDRASFRGAFGTRGDSLLDAALAIAPPDLIDSREPTSFTPLWVMAGLAQRPHIDERGSLSLAVTPWHPDDFFSMLEAIISTYTPSGDTDLRPLAARLLLDAGPFAERHLGIPTEKFNEVAVPIAQTLACSGQRTSEISREAIAYFHDALSHVATSAIRSCPIIGDGTSPATALARAIDELRRGCHALCPTSRQSPLLFTTPGTIHRCALGIHPTNPFVTVRAVGTAMSESELRPGPEEHSTAVRRRNVTVTNQVEKSESASNDAQTCTCPEGGENCSCGASSTSGDASVPVFALGRLRHAAKSVSRRNAISQALGADRDFDDPEHLIAYLKESEWAAESVDWILMVENMPAYAIKPSGSFAAHTYAWLRRTYEEQCKGEIETLAIAGTTNGIERLQNGFQIPILTPDLRGCSCWRTSTLLQALCNEVASEQGTNSSDELEVALGEFLDRAHHELANPGRTPEERAINYAATNALEAGRSIQMALAKKMILLSITAEPNPLAIPGAECFDVKLTFGEDSAPGSRARKRVYRITTDVTDVVPSIIGRVRAWTTA